MPVETPGFSLKSRVTIRPGSVLELKECLKIAQEQNPQVLAARYLQHQATAVARQAKGALLPQVKLTGRAATYMDPQRVSPVSNSGASSLASDKLGTWEALISLNLFSGGRDLWRIRAAGDLETAARLESQNTTRMVTWLVVSAYLQAVTRQAISQAMEKSAQVMESQAKREQTLLEQDKSSLLALTRIQVRAAELRDRAAEERSQAELAKLRLFHLLGHPMVDVRFEPIGEENGEVPDARNLPWEKLLARRPDLRAARLRIRSQRARMLATEAEFWPSLNLVGSFGQRLDITEWPPEEERWRNSGYFGLEFSWNPFEGGRIWYQSRIEEASLRAQIESLRSLEQDAVLEIRTALHQWRDATSRMKTARASLELATTSLELEQKRMELGQSTFTEFQLVEAAHMDAKVRLLQLVSEVRVARIRYLVATGEPL